MMSFCPHKCSRVFITFTFLIAAVLFASANKVDSLKALLKTELSEQAAFENCILLGNEFRTSNVDSAIRYHELALTISKKISSLAELKAKNELAFDKVRKKDVDGGLSLLRKVNALVLAYDKNQPEVNAILELNYEYLGITVRKKDSLFASLDYFEKALAIAEKTKNLSLQADICNNTAQSLYMLGSYPKSLEYCLRGLKVNEKRNDKPGIASSTGNAGILFKELGDYKKALHYFQSALKMNELLNNKKSIAVNLGNIGVAYNHLGKNDLAFEYYLKAAEMHNELGAREGLIYNYNNIGVLYNKDKAYDKAISYYEKALAIAQEAKDNYAVAHTFIYLGTSYAGLKNYSKAQDYLDKSFVLCQKLSAIDLIQEYYEAQHTVHMGTGKFEKALECYKKYIEYKDSVVNEGNLRKSIQLEASHKFEKKLSEDSLLHRNALLIRNAELDKKNAEIKADKNLQLGLYGCVALFLVSTIFIYNRFKVTNKQKNVIHKQKEMAENQKHLIEEKQKEIIDSINYAKRIQFTLLAHDDLLLKNLPEHFVLFKPKDIVSGDFYWATERYDHIKKEKQFYLAVCDSTGHGVPGAFMGLLNTSFLNEAVNEKNIHEPAEVFEHVRSRLVDSISRDGGKDGMDAILIKIVEGKNEITYAAAYNQPLLVRKGELIQPGYDKIPIGQSDRQVRFSQFSMKVEKGDVLYLYTDGYADQFGGAKGGKLKEANLKKLLVELSNKNIDEQKIKLESEFNTWRGELEQVDDVCVIGIRM